MVWSLFTNHFPAVHFIFFLDCHTEPVEVQSKKKDIISIRVTQ